MVVQEEFLIKDMRLQPWCFLYYATVVVLVLQVFFTPLFMLWLTIAPMVFVLRFFRICPKALEWSSHELRNDVKEEFVDAAAIAKTALARCDESDRDFDLSKIDKTPLLALTFSGGVNVSLQYFGQLYFLKKHRLINESTKFYGCSTGAPNAALAVVVADSASDQAQSGSPLFSAVQRMVSAHRVLKKQAWRMLYMGPFYVVLLTNAVMDSLAELLKEHGAPPVFGRLQIALCKPLSWEPLWMFTDFKDVGELRDVLMASQLWPFLHQGTPWVWIRGKLIVDGGFTNLTPVPRASPSFVVKRSDEKGSHLASSECDVIEQVLAGYVAAYQRCLAAKHHDYTPSPLPRRKSFKIVAFQALKFSWVKGIFDFAVSLGLEALRRIMNRLTGKDADKSK